MSGFTDKQKQIMDELLDFKEKNDIQGLQCIRLLRRHASFLALKCDSEPRESVTVYTLNGDDGAKNKYYDAFDFLYFIERLLREGYIECQTVSKNHSNNLERDDKTIMIYDRESYKYYPKEEALFRKDIEFWLIDDKGNEYSVDYNKEITYTETVGLFKKYEKCIVFPLDTLQELKRNDYLTTEEYRYEQQIEKQNQQIKVQNGHLGIAKWAFIISTCFSVVSLCFTLLNCKGTSTDLNSIREAIQQSKIEIPASIAVSHLDTLQVNEINSENNPIKGVEWELSKQNKTLQTSSGANSKSNL